MRSVLVFSFLAFCSVASAQIIDFPDARFKNVLVFGKCVDTDGDGLGDVNADLNNNGEIEWDEALEVISLNVSLSLIYNLDGIEFSECTRVDKIGKT